MSDTKLTLMYSTYRHPLDLETIRKPCTLMANNNKKKIHDIKTYFINAHWISWNYRKVACHRRVLEDFLLVQVVEDDVIDGVEQRIPCLFALVIQVADLRQHLDDYFPQLVESFFRNASSLVISAHFIQQFYNFFHSAWLSQTVYGCTEHRPKGFNFRVEKRERFYAFIESVWT